MTEPIQLTKKDFMSDQTIRWCPGCGDYSILAQVQTVFAEIGRPTHEFAVISGIGCSSRFPYYMNTYGFHTIHGRAPAFATGVKLANPDLSVWQITGDGDALSIGGNHLIHALRRNVDMQILLFNNRIYGLTKGQYSPTSEIGKKTKSTPMGSIDHPVEPCALALGSDATFICRTMDLDVKHLRSMLHEAYNHKGCSFVEIFQECNIFNEGAFDSVRKPKERKENALYCEHGKPLLFNKDTQGIRFNTSTFTLETVTLGEDGITEADILVHDETNLALATMLVRLKGPVAFGVLYRVERECYVDVAHAQIQQAKEKSPNADIARLLYSDNTWVVE
jgi:2-oxoglutarate ferredoxin oxidoreductase subunit beta